jgi:hypothetical protein
MKLSIVPHQFVEREWRRASRLLRPAVDKSADRWTIDQLRDDIMYGDHLLWYIYDDAQVPVAALTTLFKHYPNGTWLELVFVGGTMAKDWLPEVLDKLEQFAKQSKCQGMEAVARRGFDRILKERDYDRPCSMYQKKFKEE